MNLIVDVLALRKVTLNISHSAKMERTCRFRKNPWLKDTVSMKPQHTRQKHRQRFHLQFLEDQLANSVNMFSELDLATEQGWN